MKLKELEALLQVHGCLKFQMPAHSVTALPHACVAALTQLPSTHTKQASAVTTQHVRCVPVQDVAPFEAPKVELEQYPTGAHIAARMLYTARTKHCTGLRACNLPGRVVL
jgi:hypothetical protein